MSNTRRRTRGIISMLTVVLGAATARSAYAQSASAVSDLPLTWVEPRWPSAHVTAVLMSGDGGWAELVKQVADGLSAKGIGVVGFNSRTWLSSPKTPDATAAAIVRVINASTARWPTDRLLLIGYSRGADMAPFVASRLPAAIRAQLAGVAMFGLASMASFEFHLIDLVKDTRRASDIPLLPELEKLKGVPMVCVYGKEEETSGCRDAPEGIMMKDARSGGHHFDKNTDALVADIMALLDRSHAS